MDYIAAHELSFILLIVAVLFTLITQISVSSTFKKYSKIKSRNDMTGKDAAELILRSNDLGHVRVEMIEGELSDYYDPREKALRLSEGVYNSTSIAAISVAAHEAGHAIQDAERYPALVLRSVLVPTASIGSKLPMVLLLVGIFIPPLFPQLITIAIYIYLFVVIFTIVTLPVEFNASRRALKILDSSDYLAKAEMPAARSVLNAAAMTYVAAAFTALMMLFRFIAIRGRN